MIYCITPKFRHQIKILSTRIGCVKLRSTILLYHDLCLFRIFDSLPFKLSHGYYSNLQNYHCINIRRAKVVLFNFM